MDPMVTIGAQSLVAGAAFWTVLELLKKPNKRQTLQDEMQHLYVVGQSGTGKTWSLLNDFLDKIDRGFGGVWVEVKGKSSYDLISRIPSHRLNDVIFLDTTEDAINLGVNILETFSDSISEKMRLSDEIANTFDHLWGSGNRLKSIVRHASLLALYKPNAVFLDIYRIICDPRYRNGFLSEYLRDSNEVLNRYWSTFDSKYKEKDIAPVIDRLDEILANPVGFRLFSISSNKLSIKQVMDENKILVVHAPRQKIGIYTSYMVASIIMIQIQLAGMARGFNGSPFFVYADEFQNYVNPSMIEMVAMLREFNIKMTFAHQVSSGDSQIPEHLLKGILGICSNKKIFRVGPYDAEFYLKFFENKDSDRKSLLHKLLYLKNYEAFEIMLMDGKMNPPKVVKQPKLKAGQKDKIRHVIEHTIKTYGCS